MDSSPSQTRFSKKKMSTLRIYRNEYCVLEHQTFEIIFSITIVVICTESLNVTNYSRNEVHPANRLTIILSIFEVQKRIAYLKNWRQKLIVTLPAIVHNFVLTMSSGGVEDLNSLSLSIPLFF